MKRFGFTLSFLLLAFLYSCFAQTQDKPEVSADSNGVPKLEIVGGDTYDWKDVTPKNNPLTAKIKIRNTGSAMLIIPDVKPACGCTTAPLDNDSLMPGEEATLDVTLRISDRSQNLSKTITLITNDPKAQRKIQIGRAHV